MILFFDTETTGLPKNWKAPVTDLGNWPRLVQLAYLVYDYDGNLIHSSNEIIRPEGFTIPLESSNVHGITTEIANREGKHISEVLEPLLIQLKRASVLVAHNMAFDEKIIGSELLRQRLPNVIEEKDRICTMLETIELCKIEGPYGYKWPKLGELHRCLFNTDFEGAHDAMADIQATAKCFWKLMEMGEIKLNDMGFSNQLKIPKERQKNNVIYSPDRSQKDNSLLKLSENDEPLIDSNLDKYSTLKVKIYHDFLNEFVCQPHFQYSNKFLDPFLKYPFFRLPYKCIEDPIFYEKVYGRPPGDMDSIIDESYMGYYNENQSLVREESQEISTRYFKSHLEFYFPDMIYSNVGHSFNGEYWSPNVLIYDKKTNLHVAIQIDAPYNIETKKCEKYLKLDEIENVDECANSYFTGNYYNFTSNTCDTNEIYSESIFKFEKLDHPLGPKEEMKILGPLNKCSSWFFIKFSEFQIVCQPKECCKFIQDEILRCTKIRLSNKSFVGISQITHERMWTFETALRLMKNKMREKLNELLKKMTPEIFNQLIEKKEQNIEKKDSWKKIQVLLDEKNAYRKSFEQWRSKNVPDNDDIPF
jgi:DNA polymerase-3 subunit epsilon